MFSTISERFMHLTRWGLAIGWLVLIGSMFYDPISAHLTASGNLFAASAPEGCFQFQGNCLPLTPYPMAARIFWGMILPLSILILLIFGHEAWRRICPLSFMSQLPRALGWQRKQVISETSWLGQNALSLQFGLLFIGLNIRLLFVNSDRTLLGIFLLLTIATALTIGFLFDGKTWCNYFCPMAPVQMIYSEPYGLLTSQAHTAAPKSITQSMCRAVDQRNQEKSACVACKLGCIDIDSEGAYWEGITQPDRKLLYYAYIGLVLGFYLYFGLYSGNWRLLSAGVWNETNQLATLMSPGFYIAGQAIAIPKLFAVPLTLTLCSGMTYVLGVWLESHYKHLNQQYRYPLGTEQVQSRLFAIATFLAFNFLFFLGVRPTLGYFPSAIQNFISWVAIVSITLWLTKTWRRSAQRYTRERDTNLLRRQLGKLDIDFSQFLEGRSLEELRPDELYALAKVLPNFKPDSQLQIYKGVLQDGLEQRAVSPNSSLTVFASLRESLGLSEDSHWAAMNKLQKQETLFSSDAQMPSQSTNSTQKRTASKRASHRPFPDHTPDHTPTHTTVYKPIVPLADSSPNVKQAPLPHEGDRQENHTDP